MTALKQVLEHDVEFDFFHTKEIEFIDDWRSLINISTQLPDQIPILPKGSLMAALASKRRGIFWCDDRFSNWVDLGSIEENIFNRVLSETKPQIVKALDTNSRPIVIIMAPHEIANKWPILIPEIQLASTLEKKIVILALSFCHINDGLVEAAKAFDMTNQEARILAELVRLGNLRLVANHLGIGYETARDKIKRAVKKADCQRQTQLIAKITQTASLTSFSLENAAQIIQDLYNLNSREAQLIILTTQGYKRSEAAKIIGISDAVAKDLFKNIFFELSIENANHLSRIVTETIATNLLLNCASAEVPLLIRSNEPLSFANRGDGGFIAYSDYGPPNAKPIIIIHGSGTTRQLSRKLVREFQANNYRPIAIDSPGFGQTDLYANPINAFEAGAHDMKIVCDKLNIKRLDIFARGGAQIALRFAHFYPEIINKTAVINPSNQSGDSAKMPGPLGLIMRKIFQNADNIELLAKWLGSQCTPARVKFLLKFLLRSSPPDLKVFENEDELEDYQLSSMMFITGRINGFVNEHKIYNKPMFPPPLKDASNWIVFTGVFDPIQNPKETKAFWGPLLPNARFIEYQDGGHLIHLSHTKAILEEFSKIGNK